MIFMGYFYGFGIEAACITSVQIALAQITSVTWSYLKFREARKFSLALCPGRRGSGFTVSATEKVKDTGDEVGVRERDNGKRFPMKIFSVLCEAERIQGLQLTEGKTKCLEWLMTFNYLIFLT